MKTEIQTVIFDLDGTIIDTEPSAALAIRDCFKAWGIQIEASDAHFITGRTWGSAFEYLFKKYPLPVPRPEAEEMMMKHYVNALEESLIVVPGSVEAVKALSEKYPLALVSGSRRSEILWALKKLEILDHFKVVLGCEDYPRSKPEPDGFAKALQMLKTEAERSLVFEDSQAGIRSARTAGSWVVAITGTNHFKQDTTAAHHHIPDLRAVNPRWVIETSQAVFDRFSKTR